MLRGTKTLVSCSWMLLLATAASLSGIASVRANTAVLFGATGAVGNDVLRSILAANDDDDRPYFTKLILVGRRAFPPKVEDLLPESPADLPEVVRVEIPNLEHVDRNEELMESIAGDGAPVACFIAVGAGFPHLSDRRDWHSIEVTMAGSMARLCGKTGSTVITAFTSADSDLDPVPFSAEELTPTGTPMGWWPLVVGVFRVMGLKEQTMISNARAAAADAAVTAGHPHIRFFQPSNIITKDIRYGWLDWTLFKIHAVLDPVLPTKFHSVTTEVLAKAMVQDAVDVLNGRPADVAVPDEDGATRFLYGDFVRIAGERSAGEGTTAADL